jgi:outer membrane protein assembly factor BamD (BamD/ComL family)
LLLIKEVLKICFIASSIIFICCCAEKAVRRENIQFDNQLAIFERAQQYLEEGAFKKAYKLYSYFLKEYPEHPLTDDAAYRLCYLHVIVSDDNPYLNYLEAQKQFQKFIENYKNSRYIIACNNWLGILKKMQIVNELKYTAPVDNSSESTSTRERITQLENENKKLKAMLLELQEDLER